MACFTIYINFGDDGKAMEEKFSTWQLTGAGLVYSTAGKFCTVTCNPGETLLFLLIITLRSSLV